MGTASAVNAPAGRGIAKGFVLHGTVAPAYSASAKLAWPLHSSWAKLVAMSAGNWRIGLQASRNSFSSDRSVPVRATSVTHKLGGHHKRVGYSFVPFWSRMMFGSLNSSCQWATDFSRLQLRTRCIHAMNASKSSLGQSE